MKQLSQIKSKLRNTLISIVIPVHNEGEWVADCIDSFLEQTHKNIEIIVVDDASRDKTPRVLKQYKNIKVTTFPQNRGEGAARGEGVSEAKGKFVIQTDADARYPRDFIEKSLEWFIKDPQLQALSIGYLVVHPKQRGIIADYFRVKRRASFLVRKEGQKAEVSGFYMYKREIVDKIGNYDSSVPSGTDLDFYKRAKRAGLRYAWAENVFFEHADPDTLVVFLKRTFSGSVAGKKTYERWQMWPRPTGMILIWMRSVFVTLIPLYVVLTFYNRIWIAVLLAAILMESIGPIVGDRESRVMLYLALQKRKVLLSITLPMILFLRIRASSYGKIYAVLFPRRVDRLITFDVA